MFSDAVSCDRSVIRGCAALPSSSSFVMNVKHATVSSSSSTEKLELVVVPIRFAIFVDDGGGSTMQD